MISALTLLTVPTAWSQGFDARGPVAPPDASAPADGPWVLGPGAERGGVALRIGWQDRLLVRRFPDGTVAPVFDDVLGTDLAGLSPSFGPVQVGLVLPLVLSSSGEVEGASLADASLVVPVTFWSDDRLSLRAVPGLRLPTGSPDRYTGDGRFAPSLAASAHVGAGPVVAGIDAGFEAAAATGVAEWPGGPTVLAAVSAGFLPIERLGLHAAWRTRAPLPDGPTSVPSELGVQAKGAAGSGWFGSLGVSRALTRGVGAPALRLEAAIGWGPEPKGEAVDWVADPVAEVPSTVRVTDGAGAAVRGASVVFGDGGVAITDPLGVAAVPDGATGPIRLGPPGFLPKELPLQAEGDTLLVVLERPPVALDLRVVDDKGAAVTVPPTIDPDVPLQADRVGTWHGAVAAGEFEVVVQAPGLGTQTRTVPVGADRTDAVPIDAVLHPVRGDGALRVEVVDPLGRPVESARVTLGGQPLGATATGGDLVVSGLATKAVPLVVSAAPYPTTSPLSVTPGADAAARVVLDWPDGAVAVRALGPDGVVTDGLVAFRGPASLPPAPLGADGERLFTLRPGAWTLLISSPMLGAQERRVTVPEVSDGVQWVEVVLQPEERGEADLEVQVVGPEGPVAQAAVSLDGRPLGRTGPDGSLRALGLSTGRRALAVEGELVRSWTGEVDLFAGGQAVDVPVRWAPGAIEVEARDPDDHPVDAALAARGPSPVGALRLGDDGVARLKLDPGTWDLAVSSPAWGTQVRNLTVREDDDTLRRVVVRMYPPDDAGGALRLTVRDPLGQPLEGARVTLGGRALGTTTDGGLVAEGLGRTTAELRVEADAMKAGVQRVRITEDTPVELKLSWAPGAARVVVTGPDGPADALVAASGPASSSPRRTGADGAVVLGLAPGAWRVLASAGGLGAAEVSATLPEQAALTEVPIRLARPTPEDADRVALLVRLRDPDGAPVAGATVSVGQRRETSSAGGSVLLTGLAPGALELSIDAGPTYGQRRIPVELPAGSHQRIVVLDRNQRLVVVRAVDPDGNPVAAHIVAEGAGSVEADAAADAPARLQLVPGRWSLTARSAVGVATETVQVEREAKVDGLEIELVVRATESRMEGSAVVLGRAVPFDLDQATLRPDAVPILDDLARLLRAEAGIIRVEIAGHTDDRGGVAYNQDLSERRAAAVRDALIERGIDPERLVARGYGLLRPVAPATDEESRALNRRVEIVVLERAAAGR